MKIEKVTKNFGVPWEKEYGYSQAVKVGDTIYLAGQVSHADKGNIIGPGNMEALNEASISQYSEAACSVWGDDGKPS